MTADVTLGGLLGEALDASRRGRLATFVTGEESPAIALFGPAHRDANHAGDWYGEHAGKWLLAAARSGAHDGTVRRVAEHLIALQAPDGYLGTYAEARRFMRAGPPAERTWDGAPAERTWDVWVHAYLVLGLLEVERRLAMPEAGAAARRIGDLVLRTIDGGGVDITWLGNVGSPGTELEFAL